MECAITTFRMAHLICTYTLVQKALGELSVHRKESLTLGNDSMVVNPRSPNFWPFSSSTGIWPSRHGLEHESSGSETPKWVTVLCTLPGTSYTLQRSSINTSRQSQHQLFLEHSPGKRKNVNLQHNIITKKWLGKILNIGVEVYLMMQTCTNQWLRKYQI